AGISSTALLVERPPRAEARPRLAAAHASSHVATDEEGAHGGTMGSPVALGTALCEPPPSHAVVEDHSVLAGLQHDLEVTPRHRLIGPPAVEHAPLFPHEGDGLMVDLPRRPVEVRFDA